MLCSCQQQHTQHCAAARGAAGQCSAARCKCVPSAGQRVWRLLTTLRFDSSSSSITPSSPMSGATTSRLAGARDAARSERRSAGAPAMHQLLLAAAHRLGAMTCRMCTTSPARRHGERVLPGCAHDCTCPLLSARAVRTALLPPRRTLSVVVGQHPLQHLLRHGRLVYWQQQGAPHGCSSAAGGSSLEGCHAV